MKVNGVHVEKEEEMAEILNDYFQSVFTEEGPFKKPMSLNVGVDGLGEVEVTVGEVKEMMDDLDVRKAQGPDGVSNWVLKECSVQLADKIHKVIATSLNQGMMPKDWKRADSPHTQERGYRRTI